MGVRLLYFAWVREKVGRAEETVSARVETRVLDRLPSLAWQDQLPPLDVPLTLLRRRLTRDGENEEQAQQQQQ